MMCGGGKKSAPAAPPMGPVIGYNYAPADTSNQRKQALAVSPSQSSAGYGSELGGAAPAAPAPASGGM